MVTLSHFPPATWDDDPVAWGSVEQVPVSFPVVLSNGFENRIPGRVGRRLAQEFPHELAISGMLAWVKPTCAFPLCSHGINSVIDGQVNTRLARRGAN